MSKRFAFLTLLILLTASLALPQQARAQEMAELLQKLDAYPDVIAFNGKIAVMDAELTTVQAMAIRGKRVLVLGTNDEIRELAGPATQMIDLKGRTVLPGLIDVHTHPHVWVANHWGDPAFTPDPQLQVTSVPGLDGDLDKEEIFKKVYEVVKQRTDELGPGKWVYAQIPMKEGANAPMNLDFVSPVIIRKTITTADLDRMAPDNPVILSGGFFVSTTNSAAQRMIREKFGHDLDDLDLWQVVPYELILEGRTEEIAGMIKKELEEVASFGVTGVATRVDSVQVVKALKTMSQRGDMPVRWGWVHITGYKHAKDPTEYYSLLGDSTGQGNDYFWNIGVGNEGWDSRYCTQAEPKSLKLRAQFERSDPCARVQPGTRYYEGHLSAVKAGLRLASVHAMADGTFDALFSMMDQAMEETGMTIEQIRERGHTFDHAHLVRPDQIPKLKKYGFWINLKATTTARDVVQYSRDFGEEILKWWQPAVSLLEGGVRMTLATDAHYVETPRETSPGAWPWYGFWPLFAHYITREWDGVVWNPEQRLDRISALRGWTTWAAQYVLREDDLGSLEKGKLADFIILDRDYFAIPESEIAKITNLMTVVGGKVVYRSPQY
jgi:predicted amidohydrolase YtcJ